VLGAWQEWVGGPIQFVELGDHLVMIVNEEGMTTQPQTRWRYRAGLGDFSGTPVFGPFVVARWQWEATGDHAADLSAADLPRVRQLFPGGV
jgi:hypothetical protein